MNGKNTRSQSMKKYLERNKKLMRKELNISTRMIKLKVLRRKLKKLYRS